MSLKSYIRNLDTIQYFPLFIRRRVGANSIAYIIKLAVWQLAVG